MDVVFLFSRVIGVPIAVSLSLSSTLFLLIYSGSSPGSVAGTLFEAFEGHFTLLAIPYFILASAFMTTGGVAQWQGWAEIWASGRDAGWGRFLIVIILGGIYGGIFTPTEAATSGTDANTPLWRKPHALVTAFVHPDTRKTLLDAGKLTVTLLFVITN